MRKILLSLVFVITTSLAFGATYYGRTNGNWSDPGTWSLTDGGTAATTIPTSVDDVIMDGSINVTIDNALAVCRSLTLNNTKKNEGVSGISRITFLSGSKLVVTSAINMNGNGGRLGGIDMSAGGYLVCGSFNVTGNNPGVWAPGTGTVEVTGTGVLPAVTNAGTNTLFGSFHNLIINGGAVTLGQNTTLSGSLLIQVSASQLDVSLNNYALAVGGNWTNNGSFIPRSGTVTLNGNNAVNTQNITSGTFNNLTFSGVAPKSANGALTVNGNLTISSGSNFSANNHTHSVGGNWINSGTFNTPTGAGSAARIHFNGTGAQEIGATHFNHVTFSGTGVKRATGALSLAGNIEINTGSTFDANALTHTIQGNWINNGTFTATGSTIRFTGTGISTPDGQTISSSNFNHIAFENDAPKTAAGVLSISGNVLINEGSSFTPGSFVHNVGGNWTNNGTFNTARDVNVTAGIHFNGAAQQLIGSTNFNHVSFSGAGIKVATGALNMAGHVTINNGSTFDANGLNHTVRGNWTNNGTFLAAGSTIRFSANTGTQLIGGSNFNHIEFDNAATKTATGNLNIAGDVTINSNFNAGHFSHTVGGNWSNNGSVITPFTPANSTITFNGSGNQFIQSGSSKTTSFFNFVINKPAGRLTLSAPVTIISQVSFVNGVIDGTSNSAPLLFLENAVVDPAAGPSNFSHVNGPVRKSVSGVNPAASAFVFPVGKNGKYVPIGVSNASGLGTTIEGEYFPVSAYTLGKHNSPGLKQISQCEYWGLKPVTTANPSMDVTLGWGPDNSCTGLSYVSEPASMVIASFDPGSGTWNRHGGAVHSGATAATGKVTWGGVGSINAFTLGTMSLANALPVVFANFTATQREEGVQLAFSNLTEEDVALYHVERSANGVDFSAIGTVMPFGNTNNRADYTFLDRLPLSGANYYRIRAVENTGKTVYSDVVMLRTNGKQNSFVLYPNPARINTTLSLQMGTLPAGRYQVRVFSQAGQLLHTTQFAHAGGFVSTTVPTKGLAAGSYIVELNGAQRMVRHLLLQ